MHRGGHAPEDSGSAYTAPSASTLADLFVFIRANRLKLFTISVLIVIPCFWHREIEAGDLGSHLYNAWLAQLIHRGQLPGLWLAHPWTNVLFDYMLSGLGAILGLPAAEKIAVTVSVLVFFWGIFAMVTAATRRPPWLLVPCIALATYGWTFERGLLNYYLSLGLAFFAAAIFWQGHRWARLVALAFVPAILLAHPLGFVLLIGVCGYVWLGQAAPRKYQIVWFALAAAGILAIPKLLSVLVRVGPRTWEAATKPFYFFNGADQLLLYANPHHRYQIAEYGVIAFTVIAIAADLIGRWAERELWAHYAIVVQLYALAMISVWVMPGSLQTAPPAAPLDLIVERFTSICAAFACCVLGAMKPRRWHFAAGAAVALVFFSSLYLDTGRFNREEQEAIQLVSELPPNQRVLATISPPHGSRVGIMYILDRACISRCFTYGNYEPSSRDFRVRARAGNPYVETDYETTDDMAAGRYEVRADDPPLYEVYSCRIDNICIGKLQPGRTNIGQFYPTEQRLSTSRR